MMSDFIPNLIGTNPGYGINRKVKRRHIQYRPDQRDFTKINPEVQSAWDAMPLIQRETRQLGRQSRRVAHKNYIKGVKVRAMKEGVKGGSAALVFDHG